MSGANVVPVVSLIGKIFIDLPGAEPSPIPQFIKCWKPFSVDGLCWLLDWSSYLGHKEATSWNWSHRKISSKQSSRRNYNSFPQECKEHTGNSPQKTWSPQGQAGYSRQAASPQATTPIFLVAMATTNVAMRLCKCIFVIFEVWTNIMGSLLNLIL